MRFKTAVPVMAVVKGVGDGMISFRAFTTADAQT